MITLLEQGMSRWVAGPTFGQQHLGVAPGGAVDRFSMRVGNIMLGQTHDQRCLEIGLFPPRLRIDQDLTVLLNGAGRDAWLVRDGAAQPLPHATVAHVNVGDELHFGELHYGLRTYLAFKPGHDPQRLGLVRPSFDELADWFDPQGCIRIMPGPELASMVHGHALTGQVFKVSPRSSDVGLRLDGPSVEVEGGDMISQPVTDGTIQASPMGLIVLLRDRPTVGGYPRLAHVIGPDIDRLAQVAPGQMIRCRMVDREHALVAHEQQADVLKRLREAIV